MINSNHFWMPTYYWHKFNYFLICQKNYEYIFNLLSKSSLKCKNSIFHPFEGRILNRGPPNQLKLFETKVSYNKFIFIC
jgi:hypothetical protein